MTHIKSPVIQANDYYPFGLTFNSYKRENSIENKIRFQGQEHIDDLGINWDSFFEFPMKKKIKSVYKKPLPPIPDYQQVQKTNPVFRTKELHEN